MYLTIYEIKIGGHWQSWGGHFLGIPSLRGPEGGTPPLFQKKNVTKSCLIGTYLKSQKVSGFSEPPIKVHYAFSVLALVSFVKAYHYTSSKISNNSPCFSGHYLEYQLIWTYILHQYQNCQASHM